MNKLIVAAVLLLVSACAGNSSNKVVELSKVDIAAGLQDGTLPYNGDRGTKAHHDLAAPRNFCYTGSGLWCILTSAGAAAVNRYDGTTDLTAGDLVTGQQYPNENSDYCTADEFGGSNGGACQVSSES